MKIGDKVRFLSETGGGVVAGFQGKNIVLVEDKDGFQIPTPVNDVVVVGDSNEYNTANIVASKTGTAQKETSPLARDGKSIKAMMSEGYDEAIDTAVDAEPADREISFRAPVEERQGGNLLNCYLAFVPVDEKTPTNTRFECYLVNDCNYYLDYTYLSAEGASWSLRSHGEIEPNTKLFVEEIGYENLNDIRHIAVHLLAYKKDKAFIQKPPVSVEFRIDGVKFYKLHTFQPTDFFETPALLFTIIEKDVPARPLVIDANKLKAELYKKPAEPKPAESDDAGSQSGYVSRYDDGKQKGNPWLVKRKGDEDIVVVDLHIDTLLDSTSGMSHIDILNYQLKVFRDTLAAYKNKKGQKIVFIHGKGEGVLRHAIVNELNYRYKKYQYQDASFQEYGYGATQVTVR